ncbi:hypothetical protein H6P81_014590 [Aristolochia fimbriata]|uniref:tRNA-binding domain-containing protein n=1 Tax=Aristolochia fimbriata TaxID=158543 RepID=A0AAV7E2T5_ARIFI|nr:hypothetical protein H6P81_014590 [Aristolochia fimbriata]
MESNGATESFISKRNRAVTAVLCKRLSLDPKCIPSEQSNHHDLKSLVLSILQLLGDGNSLKNKDEVMKWIEFASSFPVEPEASITKLIELDGDLIQKSVLLGNGLKPSISDFVLYSAIHSPVTRVPKADLEKLPNLLRWIDYIQNTEGFADVFQKISVTKTEFEPHVAKAVEKLDVDHNLKKGSSGSKRTEKLEVELNSNKSSSVSSQKNNIGKEKAAEEKKKEPEIQPANKEKDAEVSVSLLNIQVGLIRKAWKHPSADSLLVEEIDLGDGNLRQVVSGLAKYFSPEQLVNRHVVLVTNVKPGKLRDVLSAGLVLCASNEDHSVVEPLLPPEGAHLGERVLFSGFEGKPEDVLNPKKKQLEKITPSLYTDDKGVATYKGTPFMTSAGPCKSSIPKATIKYIEYRVYGHKSEEEEDEEDRGGHSRSSFFFFFFVLHSSVATPESVKGSTSEASLPRRSHRVKRSHRLAAHSTSTKMVRDHQPITLSRETAQARETSRDVESRERLFLLTEFFEIGERVFFWSLVFLLLSAALIEGENMSKIGDLLGRWSRLSRETATSRGANGT